MNVYVCFCKSRVPTQCTSGVCSSKSSTVYVFSKNVLWCAKGRDEPHWYTTFFHRRKNRYLVSLFSIQKIDTCNRLVTATVNSAFNKCIVSMMHVHGSIKYSSFDSMSLFNFLPPDSNVSFFLPPSSVPLVEALQGRGKPSFRWLIVEKSVILVHVLWFPTLSSSQIDVVLIKL